VDGGGTGSGAWDFPHRESSASGVWQAKAAGGSGGGGEEVLGEGPRSGAAPRTPRNAEAPPPVTGKLIGFALGMATITFLVRVARPTTFLNMHLGDFSKYILLFIAGIFAARRKLQEGKNSVSSCWA
jgi:hypothetical protein